MSISVLVSRIYDLISELEEYRPVDILLVDELAKRAGWKPTTYGEFSDWAPESEGADG